MIKQVRNPRKFLRARTRLGVVWSLLAPLLLIGITNPQLAFAAPTISLPATLTAGTSFTSANSAGALSISGYDAGASVQVTVSVTSGYVKIATTTGLTAPTGYTSAAWTSDTSAEIAFYGSQTNVSNALNSLLYKATAVDAPATITVTSFVAGAAYNSTTGHFYEIVDNGSLINWELARCKALYSNSDISVSAGTSLLNTNRCTSSSTLTRRTLGGLQGYLATITSQAEQDFIYSKLTSTGWIGGADTDSEGTFVWMDGPEKSQVFWTSGLTRRTTNTVTGSVSGFSYGSGRFNYFSDGEPNDAGGAEDFAEFGFGTNGAWNDCQNACNRTKYVIEYGETGDTLSGASGTINVNPRTAITTDTDTALSLSGSQYLSSAQESPFDIATGTTFTLEAWVKPTITNANQILIGKDNQYSLYISSNGSYGMNFYTTNVPSGVGGDSSIFRAGIVKADQWQHVAVVRNGTSITGYVNGQVLGTFTAGSATDAIKAGSSPFVVGGYSTTNQPFTGQIDQVRVWSSARTAAEIQSGMSTFIPTPQTSLIASYGFNELAGTKIFNNATSSTWETDLTLNGGSSNWSQIAETSTVGAYSVVTFARSYLTAAGGWKLPSTVQRLQYLIVAGGGAGGTAQVAGEFASGGGGGGGVRTGIASTSSQELVAAIVGSGQVSLGCVQGRGQSSSISSNSISTISATGGGSGACIPNTSAPYTMIAANSGGSGGGGGSWATSSAAVGSGNLGSFSPVEGYAGAAARTDGSYSTGQAGGGGGGAGAVGGSPSLLSGVYWNAGSGGVGVLSTITGSNVYYGGGGGGGKRSGGVYGAVGSGGSGGGGDGGDASSQGTSGTPGLGGGGGGNSKTLGNDGGSGVIIIRWITASKPTYTKPTNAYLNVGMTETFTTNVAADSATITLTRTFLWESSTTGAGGPFTRIKSGTGAANAAFSWVPSDSSTSGSDYLYRLTVTDSDTAGLFITDSSTAFAVINGTLVVTGNSSIQTTLGKAYSETYTVTQGTIPYTHTLSPTTTGITLDTTTVGSPVVKLASTLTVGSYPETLTVTDSVTATVTKALSLTVNPNPTISPPTINAGNQLVNLNSAESASYSGSGSTWSDLSGNGKNASLGIISGGPLANGIAATCTAPTYSSASGGIFNFDGVNNCAYISTLASLDTFTVEMWVKSNGNQINNTGLIFTPYSSGENINFGVYFDNSGNIYATTSLSGTSATTPSTPFASGAWIHVAVVSSSRTLTLYLNGVSKSSVSLSFSPAGVSKGVFIGRSGGAGINFNGSISMVKIGSSGYSATQIQQNYYITSGRYSTTAIGVATVNSKYGVSTSQAFTVNNGTGNKRFTATPNNRVGISWDTATVNSATLSLAATLTPGTYYETLTATDSVSATSSVALTLLVAKADSITVTTTLSSSSVTYTESPANVTVTQTVTGLVNSETGTATTTYTGISCEYGGSCKIGDVAPGGGYVFYESATTIDVATGISTGGIYLATAPQTWGGGSIDPNASWGCSGTDISSTSVAVGSGAENTRLINAGCATSDIASRLAADSTAEGFTDWFIPSRDELTLIYNNLKVNSLSNLQSNNYWSSSQGTTSGLGRYWWFGSSPASGEVTKTNSLPVRAIRAFSPTAPASNTIPTDAGVYKVGSTFAISSPASLGNYLAVESVTATLTINKAKQKTITIGQYDAYPGISSYPLNVYGGSGPGTLTRTLVSAGTAGCSLASSFILTATTVGSCTVKAEKAGTRNYIVESTTATIYWINFVTNYATQTLGGNHAIPLNGGNQIVVRTETLTASAFSNTSGGAITSAAVGTTIRINSTGFSGLTPSNLSVTFKPYEDAVITAVTSTYVEVVIPTGATTGVIIVDSPRGVVYTQSFTISP